MQRIHNNDSVVWWSMWVLFVWLGIVYTIFFSLWSPLSSNAIQSLPSPSENVLYEEQWSVSPLPETQDQPSFEWMWIDEGIIAPTEEQQEDMVLSNNISTRPLLPETPFHIVSTQQLFFPQIVTTPSPSWSQDDKLIEMLDLPWTHHRKWVMRSAHILWFNHKIYYILKNNDNTHFAYLGKELPDITQKLSELEGKTLAITHKNDINIHWLFGDKVIYLLVPQYIGKKALFFVQFAEAKDRWFLQIDSDIFETTKPLLRELFAKRYNR